MNWPLYSKLQKLEGSCYEKFPFLTIFFPKWPHPNSNSGSAYEEDMIIFINTVKKFSNGLLRPEKVGRLCTSKIPIVMQGNRRFNFEFQRFLVVCIRVLCMCGV